MNKLKILLYAIVGNLCKVRIWFHLWFNIKPKRSEKVAENVIVSLTSYGRRVAKCAPYAVFSMIVQTMRPEKITLWLDKEKWNDGNLPFALKRMQSWGMIEVEYCRDVRSYTKLIPALKKYPDKAIITIDDDIYYSKNLVIHLFNQHRKLSDTIIASRLCSGSYNYEGKDYKFPLGTGGILYPPKCLSNTVFDENIFMSLCPSLDDLWFYTISLLKGTKFCILSKSLVSYYHVDAFYQRTHSGSKLHDIVRIENNETLKSLLHHFDILKSNM